MARTAGSTSLDKIYPLFPIGVTAIYATMFSSYSVSMTRAETKQMIYGVITARNRSKSR